MKNFIYRLIDPETSECRYVGQSSRGMAEPERYIRYARKIAANGVGSDADRAAMRRPVYRWLVRHMSEDIDWCPEIEVVVETASADDLDLLEMFHIANDRYEGHRLLNVTDGGGGIRGHRRGPPSAETRRKISESNLGKVMSIEARLKISNGQKGLRKSPETRLKLSLSRKGKTFPNLSVALQARSLNVRREKAVAQLRREFEMARGRF